MHRFICAWARFSTKAKPFVDAPSEYVHSLNPTKYFERIRPYRVIDLEGNLVAKSSEARIPADTLNRIFDLMVTVLSHLDT